jgi:heptosyltransferase II
MDRNRYLERALHWLKGMERRFYLSDYDDLRFRAQGMGERPHDLYGEKVYRPVPEPQTVRSVLIFKPDDLGDALMALPAIGRLKARFPEARFTVLCQKANRTVFERVGWFDHVVPVDVKAWALRFRSFSVKEALARLPESEFDLSIFLRTYPAYFKSFLRIPARTQVHPVDPRLRSKSISGAPVSQWGEKRVHQTLQMLEIAGFVTGESYSAEDVRFPTFQWTDDDRRAESIAFGERVPPRFLVVHPFANFETRRYPYWAALTVRIEKATGLPAYVIGGPADLAIAGIPSDRQLQGKLTLGQSGYLLSRAAAFMGNHSGPAHWAAALGVPTVSIFSGHSLASEWGPVGKTLILSLETACTPCHLRYCAGYGLKCLTEMTPERIASDVESFLSGHLRPRPVNRPMTFVSEGPQLEA